MLLPFAQLRRRRKLFILLLVMTIMAVFVILRFEKDFTFITKPATTAITIDSCSFKTFVVGSNAWTNFPLVLPFIEPNMTCQERHGLFMVVIINSDANLIKNRLQRTAIRSTWGKPPVNNTGLAWRTFFSLGISKNVDSNNFNNNEAMTFNDIIIGNFTETYRNIVIKTFMSHYWAFSRLKCKFILKTDDDVYVRVPWLARWLNANSPLPRFYGGLIEYVAVVARDAENKWFISRQEYNGTLWPPFAHGAFHVLSFDILHEYFNYTQYRRPFHADDAFIGVASRDLRVNATDIPGFCFIGGGNTCELRTATAICHDIKPPRMVRYHEIYKDLKNQIENYM